MVRWLAERSKAGKESLYSLGVGEAEKLRNEIRQLQDSSWSGFRCLVAIHSSRSSITSNWFCFLVNRYVMFVRDP